MTGHLDDAQLSRLLDGDVSLAERSALLDHLAHCPRCAARQSELVEVSATLRSEPRLEWSGTLTAAVLERLPAEPAPPRRHVRPPVAMLLAGLVAALSLGAVAIAPIGLFVASRLFTVFATLPPLSVATPRQAFVGLIVVALALPAFLYPLARWR